MARMLASQFRFRNLLALVLLAGLAFEGWSFVQPTTPSSGVRVANQQVPAPQKGLAMGEGHADAEPAEVGSNVWRMIAAVCAAVLVTLLPLSGAEAARSGGRMGGMGGGARRAMPPPQAQRQGAARSGPNISIGVGPMIAPPMYGSPFGFGAPMGMFGPPLLLPGPSFGPSATDQALQNQQRQDERAMDSQKMQIESLQREIQELKAKKQ
mmetsp:Transcript_55825/g.107708  ORF Transcript_55825/g.107708 Transcript_55825/m.107708 type:complete len:210 (+) Transcript_55825:91-720(+)